MAKYGKAGECAMLFPSRAGASRCVDFVAGQAPELGAHKVRTLHLVAAADGARSEQPAMISPNVSAVLFPREHFRVAKAFWQHTGEGISSRRAEHCHALFREGALVDEAKLREAQAICRGPRRYQRTSVDHTSSPPRANGGHDSTRFVEERFGRNLDVSLASNAKLAVRRRIAGSLTANVELAEALALEKDAERTRGAEVSEDDVYLYPGGMNAIFHTHQNLLAAKGALESIVYGFPYIDTLKMTQKFGPGCLFLGFGSADELDELEARLAGGHKYLALFTEFPSNPLLQSADLARIRGLADRYGFWVVVDETVGNFVNVHVLQYADVVVSSLTKVFSGDSNVMGGRWAAKCARRALGTDGHQRGAQPPGARLRAAEAGVASGLRGPALGRGQRGAGTQQPRFCVAQRAHQRQRRGGLRRVARARGGYAADGARCGWLTVRSVKQVNYPKHSETRAQYDACRTAAGGYGGLLSATFHGDGDAVAFYDALDTAKGPSLGTNFTLRYVSLFAGAVVCSADGAGINSSPYVILAHYGELDWVSVWRRGRDRGAKRRLTAAGCVASARRTALRAIWCASASGSRTERGWWPSSSARWTRWCGAATARTRRRERPGVVRRRRRVSTS